MKNVKFCCKKTNSAENSAARLVKTQIPRLGSKFRSPQKTVGPTDNGNLLNTRLKTIQCWYSVLGIKLTFGSPLVLWVNWEINQARFDGFFVSRRDVILPHPQTQNQIRIRHMAQRSSELY